MPKQTNNSSNNAALKGFALTLVILILAVCVMAAMTEGFSNWNPYGWFDKPAEEQQTPEGDDPDEIIPPEQQAGVKILMSLATTAAEGQYVEKTASAVVSPAEAAEAGVDWTLAWTDGSEDLNISDYVELIIAEDGAATVALRCYQAFDKEMTLTVTTRDGGFSDSIPVQFVGHPSEMTVSSGSVSEIDGFYNLGTNRTYTFDIDLSNIFGQVGGTDIQITKGGEGSLYFGDQYSQYGGYYWQNVTLKTMESIFDKFLTVSLDGNILTVKTASRVIKSYHDSQYWDDVTGSTVTAGTYLDEVNNDTYREELNYNNSNYDGCYFTVTITEASTGLSETLNFKIGTGVNGVNISSGAITF